jgi:hypothetical protein
VHNFIVDHDGTDIEHYLQEIDTHEQTQPIGDLGHGAIPHAESERASALHDHIAMEMWASLSTSLARSPRGVQPRIGTRRHVGLYWIKNVN